MRVAGAGRYNTTQQVQARAEQPGSGGRRAKASREIKGGWEGETPGKEAQERTGCNVLRQGEQPEV